MRAVAVDVLEFPMPRHATLAAFPREPRLFFLLGERKRSSLELMAQNEEIGSAVRLSSSRRITCR